jgi:hypothetical protein
MKNKKVESPMVRKARRKRILNYSLLFLGLFGVTAATTYFLIPNKTATMGADDPLDSADSEDNGDPLTPVQHFTSALTSMKGLVANVTSFTASVPNLKNAADPEIISLSDTSVKLVMSDYPEVAFDLDTTVSYNGVSKDLNVSFTDSNLYLSVLGLKYRTKSETIGDLFDKAETLAKSAGLDTMNIGSSLDTSKATALLNNMTATGDTTNGFVYTLPLDDAKTQTIQLTSDGSYHLTGVSAKDLTINGTVLNFAVAVDFNAEIDTATFLPSDSASYLDIYDSFDVIQKVADLVMKPAFGVSLNVDMIKDVNDGTTTKTYQVANIAGSAAINIQSDIYGGSLALKAPNAATLLSDYPTLDASKLTSHSVAANYRGTTAQDGTKDGTVYAAYNDAFKVKMTTSVLNSLISKIKADFPSSDTSSLTKLFSFITESTVMKAVAKGHYESVITMLDNVVASNDQVVASISLKDLGLGSASKIVVTLDGNSTASSLATIAISSVALSNYTMNATFALTSYVEPTLDVSQYTETLDKLPSIYSQAYDLVQDTKAQVILDKSSVMGYDATTGLATKDGVSFSGNTAFDANQDLTKDTNGKSGTGTIDITQIKSGSDFQTHRVGIDVRGIDQMLFRYTSSASNYQDYLNGRFTIQTLNDIISLVKKLMNSTDARYTKFLDALTETTATTVVGQIMAKNYETLLQNQILKSLHVTSDAIDLVIDKKLLGSTSDIVINLQLDSASSKITAFHLTDFVISGKIINLNLTLKAFDSATMKLQTLPDPDKVTYLDFSQIEVLLQFGLTTSERHYFHLTATADVSIGSLIAVKPTLDFYISVEGADVKVVGHINNIKLITMVNGSQCFNPIYSANVSAKRNVTFYYQTGYCYLKGADDYMGTLSDSTDWIKVKDTEFVSNFLHYLLANVLECSSLIQNQVGSTSLSSSSDPIKYEDVLTGFTYNNSTATAPSWTLSLNMGVLANDDKLKDLTVTISGEDQDSTDGVLDGYLTKMSVSFNMTALVDIHIGLDAQMVDLTTDFSSTFTGEWQTYITAHANDTLGKTYSD